MIKEVFKPKTEGGKLMKINQPTKTKYPKGKNYPSKIVEELSEQQKEAKGIKRILKAWIRKWVLKQKVKAKKKPKAK